MLNILGKKMSSPDSTHSIVVNINSGEPTSTMVPSGASATSRLIAYASSEAPSNELRTNPYIPGFAIFYFLFSVFPMTVAFLFVSQNKDTIYKFNETISQDCADVIQVYSAFSIIAFVLKIYMIFYITSFALSIRKTLKEYNVFREQVVNPQPGATSVLAGRMSALTYFDEYVYLLPLHIEVVPYYSNCTNRLVKIVALAMMYLVLGGYVLFSSIVPGIQCPFTLTYRVLSICLSLFEPMMGLMLIVLRVIGQSQSEDE
jgi:hypothetical protein